MLEIADAMRKDFPNYPVVGTTSMVDPLWSPLFLLLRYCCHAH
jgi:hypothetical protein